MIEKFMHGFLNRVYDLEDYTQLEINSKLIQKIEEVIENCNNAFEFVEWLKEQGVPDEVQNILFTWKEDGTVKNLLGNLIEELKEEVEETNAKVEETNAKLTEENETIKTQLDTIAQTNKTLSINLVDYKKYTDIVNGKLDWSPAFNKIIEEIQSSENKSLTIKLPSDNLFINSPIVFDGIPSVSLIGDNIYNCRITPSSNLTVNDFIFTFKPKNVDGSAICGLSISNIWFDMENSECGGIKCSSLNDNVNFTNLHFRNIAGNAFKIVTKDKTTPLAYNFIEGVNFDKVTIIGIEKSKRNASKALVEITSETDDKGGANEIYFYRCKFYCNPTIHDKTLLNSRKAIKSDVYSKGWAITECSFVSNVDNDFIQIGSDAQVSEGHRIYSNMFENFHENEEGWASCINLKSSTKGSSNAQNFIGYNRFEYPHGIKYKYRILTSNTTVFEPFLKIHEISTPDGNFGNNIMVFGDTRLEMFRNQFFAGNGNGYDVSSELRVMSRNDSDSKDLRDIKPCIKLSTKNDDSVIDRLLITTTNETYESKGESIVSFGNNDSIAYNIYRGVFQVGSRSSEPSNSGEGSIIFNNKTKKFMGFNGTSWVELG